MYWIPEDNVDTTEYHVSLGSWRDKSYTMQDFITPRKPALPEPSVALGFLTTHKTKILADKDLDVHQKLSAAFAVPSWLWTAKEQDANGYFFGSCIPRSAGHVSVFRFMVKYITAIKASLPGCTSNVSYDWHILTFIVSKIRPRKVAMLCFDVPPEFREQVQTLVKGHPAEDLATHPFLLHGIVLQGVVELYDHALWQFRDLVRALEHDRPTIDRPGADYIGMHELSRHVLHSSEVLSTALNVVGEIIEELDRYRNSLHDRGATASDPGSVIRHQRSMLQFLHNRSLALESRLHNEIGLALHITAQHTSLSSARISEAARIDSNATKTISILGLLFLPATFVSAIFSMSFFNFSPGEDGQHGQWQVSNKIWMFWAAAVPVTGLVIGVWWLSQRSLIQPELRSRTKV